MKSILLWYRYSKYANLAQPVEHLTRNEKVVGSIPTVG